MVAPATNSTTDVPNAELVELTARFATAYVRWLDSAASSDDGLPFAQLRMLETLHCQGPQMMRTVSDGLGLSARHVTALTDALESEGLVRRVAHPTDRRAIMLELTEAGFARAEETLAPRLQSLGGLFDALSEEDRAHLTAILGELITQLDLRRRC